MFPPGIQTMFSVRTSCIFLSAVQYILNIIRFIVMIIIIIIGYFWSPRQKWAQDTYKKSWGLGVGGGMTHPVKHALNLNNHTTPSPQAIQQQIHTSGKQTRQGGDEGESLTPYPKSL